MKKLMLTLGCFCIFAAAMAKGKSGADVIVPKPTTVVVEEGSIVWENDVVVVAKGGANKVMDYVSKEFENEFGLICSKGRRAADLILTIDKQLEMGAEAYELQIGKRGVEIKAATEAGLFYGIQSLIQLLRAGENGSTFDLACQEIKDEPRFSWRSYMLDEARYFKGEDEVYRLLDIMAELKMNVFHWHLTDDAGWRLEIKKYPKLTEIGSKRKDTEIGTWGSNKTSGVPHEGFYTQDQIKEILAYAKERHIKVVPEIEMPGHASASVAAYPWLSTKNEQIEVPVKFGKHYYTYDVIDPKVQKFLEDVVSEVIDLFDTDVIHIGGDEVRFNHWEEDKDMCAHKEKMGFTSFMDIQIEFTNKMSRFIEKKGCSMMGWNEILGKNLHADDNIQFSKTSTKVAPNVVVQFWKGQLAELASAAKQGYRLVNSYHGATYLDYSHQSIPLKKAYNFNPIPEGLPKEYEKNIIGLGCQMWSEWTPTIKDIHRQTFPRLAAYAEVGWSTQEGKDYNQFIERLKPIVERWKGDGIEIYPVKELE